MITRDFKMRELTTIELRRVELLTNASVEFTLIEPTQTGLEKSIMDATWPVRNYLKEKEIHDYSTQQKGQGHKVQVPAKFLEDKNKINSLTSLYRPETKNGDPRIWFKDLKKYAAPNDILVLVEFEKQINVLNITKLDIEFLMNSADKNFVQEFIIEIRQVSDKIPNELLSRLRWLAARGPIPAMLKADTAIGRTLETELGISINSSKKPDYKGIELKTYRDNKKNRKNLFAQVPNWAMSPFKSSEQILRSFGYNRGEDFKLYCTVSTQVRNSQGLILRIDGNASRLIENSSKVGDFVYWELEELHNRLLEKHNETFWIAADSLTIDGREHFLYKQVVHTRKPITSQFDILLEQGIITVDHLIKLGANGKAVEKGPLFKIKPDAVSLLFPPSKKYSLI